MITASILDSIREGTFRPELPAGGFMIMMALLGYFRGVVKQFLTLLSAVVGFGSGWWVFRNLPGFLSESGLSDMSATTLYGASALAGLVSFGLLRVVTSWIGNLFGILGVVGKVFGKGGGKGLIGAVASLIPSSALVMLTGSALRFGGTVEDLDSTAEVLRDDSGVTERSPGLLSGLSDSIERTRVGSFLSKKDPTQDERVYKLGELLLLSGDPDVWAKLANRPDTGPAMHLPAVSALFDNENVRRAIQARDGAFLINHASVREVATRNPARSVLDGINISKVVSEVLEAERMERRSRFQPRTPNAGRFGR